MSDSLPQLKHALAINKAKIKALRAYHGLITKHLTGLGFALARAGHTTAEIGDAIKAEMPAIEQGAERILHVVERFMAGAHG